MNGGSAQPYLSRVLVDLKDPAHRFNEISLAARIASSLKFGQERNHTLIVSAPGDGSSEFLHRVVSLLKADATLPFDLVTVRSEERKPARFPFVIQWLFGDDLAKSSARLRMEWDSLALRQKLAGILILLASVLILNSIQITFALWSGERSQTNWIRDFLNGRQILAFSVTTVLGMLLPALIGLQLRSLWRPLGDENIEANRDSIIRLLRRNGFKATDARFWRKFPRGYSPVLVVIDAIDDFQADFDEAYIYDVLLPSLERTGRVIVVSISKFSSPGRMRFINRLQGSCLITKLEPVPTAVLEEITGKKYDGPCTIKQALGLRTHSHEELIEIDKAVTRFSAQFDQTSWNAWTVLAVAAVSGLVKEGVTRRALMSGFEEHRAFLTAWSADTGFSEFDARTMENAVNTLFNSPVLERFSAFNEERNAYEWDSSLYNAIASRATPLLRTFAHLLALLNLTTDGKGSRRGRFGFDVENTARRLQHELRAHPELEPIYPIVRDYMVGVLRSLRNTGEGGSCFEVASCYLLAGHTAEAEDSVIDENGILVFECLILYGVGSEEGFARLLRDTRASARLPFLLRAMQGLLSRGADEYGRALESINAQLASTKPEYKPVLMWLYVENLRQHYLLPFVVRAIKRPELANWDSFQGLLTLAGGFHLGTFAALGILNDALLLGAEKYFLDLWEACARGILTYSQRTRLSEWERLWVDFIAALLACAAVEYIARHHTSSFGDGGGYRQDLKITALPDAHRQVLGQLTSLLGLSALRSNAERVSVTFTKELTQCVDRLRLSTLLLNLGGLEPVLALARNRLMNSARDLSRATELERDSFRRDLLKITSAAPPLVRRTLRVEALCLLYRFELNVHRTLSADTLGRILDEVRAFGCASEGIDLLVAEHIAELRFSDSRAHHRKAIRLQLRSLSRLHKEASQGNGGIRSALYVADQYLCVATDLKNLGKIEYARKCWRWAREVVDSLDEMPETPEDRSALRLFDVSAFVWEVRFWMKSGDAVDRQILEYLNDKTVIASEESTCLQLLNLALDLLPTSELPGVWRAVEARSTDHDWFCCRLWCFMLGHLGLRWEAALDEEEARILDHGTSLVIGRILASDAAGIVLDLTLNATMLIRAKKQILLRALNDQNLARLIADLQLRQAAVLYAKTITTWLVTGDIQAIVTAYYGAYGPALRDRIPDQLENWSSDRADYSRFKEHGLKLLSDYRRNRRDQVWLCLHIVLILESEGRRHNDPELAEQLKGVWLELGVECVESLLKAIVNETAVALPVRELLNQHAAGLREAWDRSPSAVRLRGGKSSPPALLRARA